jgi:hypothetical protein
MYESPRTGSFGEVYGVLLVPSGCGLEELFVEDVPELLLPLNEGVAYISFEVTNL